MFEDWKQAWREAVENFRREIESEDATADSRTRGMQRQYMAAESALDRLDSEVRRTRREATEERENEQVCRRREDMARRIGDEETVRIAIEFAVRHGERATVLERKIDVFVEERALLARDLDGMKQTMAERGAEPRVAGPSRASLGDTPDNPERERQNRDFGRLEREAKERAAAERLEELKRKMK
jgi:hypothetical protein